AALGFADALRKVPFVASFASFGDDTTLLADLVLPSSLPLEEWGDAIPYGVSALGMQQPVVQTIFGTRSAWDVLLAIADQLGLGLGWPTYKDLLQQGVDRLRPNGVGQAEFWSGLLQHGVHPGLPQADSEAGSQAGSTGPRATSPAQGGGATSIPQLAEPVFSGDPVTYPFNLVVFPHI